MALVPTALPLLEKLIPLAVSSRERSPAVPSVPTYAEVGIKDAEVELWFGIATPAATPASVVDRLSHELRAFVRDPAVRERMQALGMGAAPDTTPESFTSFAADDAARWQRIAQELGMTAG